MSAFFPKIGVFNPIHAPKDSGIHIPKFKISFPNIFGKGMKVHYLPTQESECDSNANETKVEEIEARIQKVASKWEISIKDATELVTTVDSAQCS